jgi:hypothetical protein
VTPGRRPGVADAKNRTAVAVLRPDHPPTTGRLIYMPIPAARRRGGRAASGVGARVLLASGAVISVHPSHLIVIEGAPS